MPGSFRGKPLSERTRSEIVATAIAFCVIGGVIANVGYGIAIYALVLGPMAHVAALRETSVLFGALMGTLLLGEPFGIRRVVAAAGIVVGLMLMNGPQLL